MHENIHEYAREVRTHIRASSDNFTHVLSAYNNQCAELTHIFDTGMNAARPMHTKDRTITE